MTEPRKSHKPSERLGKSQRIASNLDHTAALLVDLILRVDDYPSASLHVDQLLELRDKLRGAG